MFERIQDLMTSRDAIPAWTLLIGLIIGYNAAPNNHFEDRVNECISVGKHTTPECIRHVAETQIEAYYYSP